MAKILVVGGAGYVGSAASAWLIDQGHDVWVLDDLSTGHLELALGRGFTRAQAGNREAVKELLTRESFDCAMHFAAKSLVSESVQKPELYHQNNVVQTRILLETLLEHRVKRFIFSSTCAIFGEPGNRDIHEDLPKNPINPYGQTKLEAEKIMQELAASRGLQAIALRYFNAAGAEPMNRVGEKHRPESHLIPNILAAAIEDREVSIFGDDYPTPDGTCVRDYIHVSDLAAGHEAAMKRLLALDPNGPGSFEAFNLGSEQGYSVKEVIDACRRMTGKPIRTVVKERRPGDPPRLVADSTRAKKELGFAIRDPETALDRIIASAWQWETKKRKQRRAVFLDRDGTINHDPGYISQPEQMQLLPGAGEALAKLNQAGFVLVVVSNQSGVGRGIIQRDSIPLIHGRMEALLATAGARIDHYELCFHKPDEGCECRKPRTGLLAGAAQKLGIDVSRSYMVGDKILDLDAGRNAGCKGVALVRTGYGSTTEAGLSGHEANFVGDSITEVVAWILAQESASS